MKMTEGLRHTLGVLSVLGVPGELTTAKADCLGGSPQTICNRNDFGTSAHPRFTPCPFWVQGQLKCRILIARVQGSLQTPIMLLFFAKNDRGISAHPLCTVAPSHKETCIILAISRVLGLILRNLFHTKRQFEPLSAIQQQQFLLSFSQKYCENTFSCARHPQA